MSDQDCAVCGDKEPMMTSLEEISDAILFITRQLKALPEQHTREIKLAITRLEEAVHWLVTDAVTRAGSEYPAERILDRLVDVTIGRHHRLRMEIANKLKQARDKMAPDDEGVSFHVEYPLKEKGNG